MDSRGVFILQEAKFIPLTIRTQRLHDGNDARRGERGRAVEGWTEPGENRPTGWRDGEDGGERRVKSSIAMRFKWV